MNKEDVKRAYHAVRDSKLALDGMLGSAPAEVRQAYHDQYKKDVGAFTSVSHTGVPIEHRLRNKKSKQASRSSRASRSNARYQAAVVAVRTAMVRHGWVA